MKRALIILVLVFNILPIFARNNIIYNIKNIYEVNWVNDKINHIRYCCDYIRRLDYDSINDDIYIVDCIDDLFRVAMWSKSEMLYINNGEQYYKRPDKVIEKLFDYCSEEDISIVLTEKRNLTKGQLGTGDKLVAKISIRNGVVKLCYVKKIKGYF